MTAPGTRGEDTEGPGQDQQAGAEADDGEVGGNLSFSTGSLRDISRSVV
jgi:hypothetical protein